MHDESISMADYQLYTITLPDGEPTLEHVARKFNLPIGALNDKFGVVEVDTDARVYSVEVEEDAAQAAGLTHDMIAVDEESDPAVAPIEEAQENLEVEDEDEDAVS